MSYAIIDNEPLKSPQFVSVEEGADAVPGEFFRVEKRDDIHALVIAEDGLSLREKTQAERDAQALASAKSVRLAQIQQAYERAIVRPVSVLGFQWKGGESSAAAIGGAINLAVALGVDEVELWPNDATVGQMIEPDDAHQILVAVGLQFQSDFKLRKVARGHVFAATTIAAVGAVAIPSVWT